MRVQSRTSGAAVSWEAFWEAREVGLIILKKRWGMAGGAPDDAICHLVVVVIGGGGCQA